MSGSSLRAPFNAALNEKIHIYKTAYKQYRPYLSLSDAYKAIKAIFEKNIFDRQVYNILSDNFTVNQILNLIRDEGYRVKVKLTNSRIMNQLSYKVSKEKFEKKAVKLNASIKKDIKQTLDLFKNVNTLR